MPCHHVRHRRHHNTRRRKIATDIAKGVLERRLHTGHAQFTLDEAEHPVCPMTLDKVLAQASRFSRPACHEGVKFDIAGGAGSLLAPESRVATGESECSHSPFKEDCAIEFRHMP